MAKYRAGVRTIEDRLSQRVAEARGRAVQHGTLASTMHVQALTIALRQAITAKIQRRLLCEIDVHRRAGSSFSKQRQAEVVKSLNELVRHDVDRFYGRYIPGAQTMEGAFRDAREELLGVLQSEVAVQTSAAAAELAMQPAASAAVAIINVNVPSEVVVANQIGSLAIEGSNGNELRDVLQELLDASRDLGAQSAEARALLSDLVDQASSKTPARAMVREAIEKLIFLASIGDGVAKIADLAQRLGPLLEAAWRSLPR